jgi:hypothetical protein
MKWWQPQLDTDPGPTVRAVALVGADPSLQRAVRIGHDKWVERGTKVNFYADRTPPMRWHQVGLCWANRSHPVVEANP